MLRRERLVNKLKDLGYRFHRDTRRGRVKLFRRGTDIVAVTQHDLFDEEAVRSILSQCGMKNEDIQMFIAANTSS